MQICIVYAGRSREDAKIRQIAEALGRGISAAGNNVDIFNMYTDSDKKLTFYDYVVVGSSSKTAFGGNLPDIVSSYLKRAGELSGKRSFAFVTNAGIREQKTLHLLMKAMEGEGLYLKYSEVLKKPGIAEALGKRLNG